LLEDIWTVFDQANLPRLPTAELLDKLIGLEESPWREAHHGKAINDYYLRENLKPYFKVWEDNEELQNARKWRDGKRSIRGYAEAHFEDAWLRHIQKLKPSAVRKDEEEAAKERAEDDAGGEEKGDIIPSPLPKRSAPSATCATNHETLGISGLYVVPDTAEHPPPTPEHPPPEQALANGSALGGGSIVGGVGSSMVPATEQHQHNQDDRALASDGADGADTPARGEGIVPPFSHLRGARSRQRRGV
jgi:hypothetical protein